MKLLYQAGIYAYSFSARIAASFNPKAGKFIKGRKNWKRNLASKIESNARYIWIHCASLGEFEQGRPLIEEIRNQLPEYRIVLTFFSPSGYEIRKNYEQAEIVSYLPIDTPGNAKSFLNIVRPEKAFFVKYEYWHSFINEINKKEIPLYIISAIFRDNQQFFKNTYWGKWYRKMLHLVTHFFVQDEHSANLLQSVGITNYTITGDTRFDRVATIAKNAVEIPVVEKFRDNKILLIAGSTWKPDEELLSQYMSKNGSFKMIIAPHEVTPANIGRLDSLFENAVRFSELKDKDVEKYKVLIIDSVGMLSSLYQYGNMAYIGGGFGVGIHNILEAATFGLPVVFGPNYTKFKEAVDLTSFGGAFPITDYQSLQKSLSNLLSNPQERKIAAEASRKYVDQNVGSTQKIIEKVFNK